MIIISANTVVQAASVSNLVTPVSYFINHVVPLDNLKNNLEKYKQTSIVGTSGIGKTQLTRMYAYENKDKYSLIWFIDCNFNLKQEFLKLAKTINQLSKKQLVSEDLAIIEEEVINYLSTLDNWLLVFDNNKTKGNLILQKFIKLKHNGHVIFCSQDSQGLPYVVKVKEFTKKDAAVLAGYILKDNSVQDVNFLIEEFKGYPVLIVQGAQILNNVKGLSNVKYKKMIKETDNKIKLNIELCMKELSTSAKALLQKIALINNQRFSKNMLRMITNNKENFDDDIYQLSRFLLISNIDSNKDDPVFEMHDVIAETLQGMNTKIKNQQYLEEMISNILEKSFPKGVAERQIFRTASTIIENLQIILRNAEKYKINLSKILEVKIELLGISVDVGDYNSSQKLIEWFEEKNRNKEFNLDQMNNHEKVLYVWYLSTTGFYNMVALSNPIKAIEYYIKAKEIAVSIDGYEDMKFNVTYQIFRAQLELGQIKFAQNTLEEAYKIYEIGIKNNTINSSEMRYFILVEQGYF
ncbi:unnamed protein product [Rotaria magnacalcarata]|uniref:NB-ARC domain-containing protein n=1 Tax=Rotaria magnacalcarata TaxID=392030 RepID=A0A816ZUA1_9BILA|nr:unnamed protein product [Rotaria magnacalcarata]